MWNLKERKIFVNGGGKKIADKIGSAERKEKKGNKIHSKEQEILLLRSGQRKNNKEKERNMRKKLENESLSSDKRDIYW